MKIEPRTFTLPNGEVLTVRSLCADDAEALNAFRYATYSETYFMARYPEEGANLEAMGNWLADCGESPANFEVGAFAGEKLVGEFGVAQVRPHIKYRHRDRKGMADDPDCHPHLEKVFKEHPGVDVVHVVLFRQHGDQLITKYKCDNHTGNRYNDRIGKILYHTVNVPIPALRCLPNLSSNLTGLFIDIGIHCCQVGTYHACQKIPHPFFNRFKYPIHESSPS